MLTMTLEFEGQNSCTRHHELVIIASIAVSEEEDNEPFAVSQRCEFDRDLRPADRD
jgi:hypothetical protein